MKCLHKSSKGHNSVNILWTVASKQYALLNIMGYLYIKFQLNRISNVGGVSWKRNVYKILKGHDSVNIWWTVTMKQYALLHIMV